MNPYIEKLNEFLATQPPILRTEDAGTLLELLCYYYCCTNSVDSTLIRCQFHAAENALPKLSIEEYDAFFAITTELCLSYEKKAFTDGILVGMQLFKELNGPEESRST